jgi:outer membrane protein TolC
MFGSARNYRQLWLPSRGAFSRLATGLVLAVVGGSISAQTLSPQPAKPVQLPLSARQPSGITVQQSATPPPGSSVDTINMQIQVSGEYSGSAPGKNVPSGSITLTMEEAVRRGLATNLGIIGAETASMQARAERLQARSLLLPIVNGNISENAEKLNLAVEGFSSSTLDVPISFPTVVGPFHYYDAHGSLQQRLMDFTAVHNLRSANHSSEAANLDARQAREEVVLAVAGVYLRLLASMAEVEEQQVEVKYAEASYKQAQAQVDAGNKAPIEANRSLVELQTERQRLRSQLGGIEKQKNQLARLIGLPLGLDIQLSEKLGPILLENPSVESAIGRAWAQREDLKSADAQLCAAEEARKAASAERIPIVSLAGLFGIQGVNPNTGSGVFQAAVALNIPIFQGGRIEADTVQADAVVQQRRAELADQRGVVELDVRNADIDLEVANEQVGTAESNRKLALQNLQQSQDRFAVGVADSVEVVNSQEALAAADHDYVSSLFSQYLSRIAFAHAMGEAEKDLPELFKRNQP